MNPVRLKEFPPRNPHWTAENAQGCYDILQANQLPAVGEPGWCNATWDTVLCWPAIPPNTSFALPCPPLKGLDPKRNVNKRCHEEGLWDVHPTKQILGYPPQGWTNYTVCLKPEWMKMIRDLKDPDLVKKTQEIARIVRYIEFVGLALSFITLIISLAIFLSIRRLRVFRNQLHIQLKVAILIVVIIRFILYIDSAFTRNLGNLQTTSIGRSINTSKYICEAFYILLEYAKTVSYAWAILEGFYLHNSIVFSVFLGEPSLKVYCAVGWGIPVVHVALWVIVVYARKGVHGVEKCLGQYYSHVEMWILDGPRVAELVLNMCFLLNIVGVLWLKVRQTGTATAADRKSVKAAVMLMPLLGIPNILQLIPLPPTKENIFWFTVFTYVATVFYFYQGFFISLLYCLTNREVIIAIKTNIERYKIRHASTSMLRRGSRAPSYGLATMPNGTCLSPQTPSPANGRTTAVRSSPSSPDTRLPSEDIQTNRSNSYTKIPHIDASTFKIPKISFIDQLSSRQSTPPPSYEAVSSGRLLKDALSNVHRKLNSSNDSIVAENENDPLMTDENGIIML